MCDKRPKVFILEDETALAIVLEDMVIDSGYEPVMTVGNIRDAERVVGNLICDCALIDINVGGERSFSIAQKLVDRGTPFAFLTGYDPSLALEFGSVPVLQKPYTQQQVQRLLNSLVNDAHPDGSDTRRPSNPFEGKHGKVWPGK